MNRELLILLLVLVLMDSVETVEIEEVGYNYLNL
jgi:hypothetical protein